MSELQLHPVAEIFPPMSPEDFDRLCADVKAHGLRESIWLHPDGSILDGRHRYKACARVGVEPLFRTWDGNGSPAAFVVSLNLHRRHLDESQRALVAAKIATLSNGQRASAIAEGGVVTQPDAAQMLNVSVDSVGRARRVLEDGAPALVEAVERGEVAVSAAAALTQLEPEDQATVVALPEDERREAIRDVREGRIPHVAHNSGNNEWYTPKELIEAARKVLGAIDLDPASCEAANTVIKAATFYSIEDNGLEREWKGRTWLNPPYAKDLIPQFADKLVDAYLSKRVPVAIALVNNATETGWFRTIAEQASAVCFPAGRVQFWNPAKESAAPLQGQAVLYLGPSPVTFHARFAGLGTVWVKP